MQISLDYYRILGVPIQAESELIEQAYNDLMTMSHSATDAQREELHRMRLQLQQLQNQMIITPH